MIHQRASKRITRITWDAAATALRCDRWLESLRASPSQREHRLLRPFVVVLLISGVATRSH